MCLSCLYLNSEEADRCSSVCLREEASIICYVRVTELKRLTVTKMYSRLIHWRVVNYSENEDQNAKINTR